MSVVKRQKVVSLENDSLVSSQNSREKLASSVLYDEAVSLAGHEGPVLSAKFSNSGNYIASSGIDKSILLWNLPVDEQEADPNFGVLSGHRSAVTSISWLIDDSTIVSSSADSTVGYWDAETGTRIRKCNGHRAVVNQVSVSSDGTAVSVGDDGTAFLWDVREKNAIGHVSGEYPLLTTTFDQKGHTIFFSGIDPTIRVHDIRRLDKELWNCSAQIEAITSLAINNDDSVLVARSMDGSIKTYSAKEYIPEGISRVSPYVYEGAPSGSEFQLIRSVFSTDNITIYSGSEDKTITAWDFASRKITNKYTGHEGTVIDVDYNTKYRVVLSSSTDGTVIVREV
ncbi:WD40-repeat-containing domain protein [Scheffersomyces xylosifermentans]|uniref:WD40-repeat-containing domain protein n=1 Tax=Scheffersomyces xylosifermentans TaxID=1304137 RepID=UPI00315D9054